MRIGPTKNKGQRRRDWVLEHRENGHPAGVCRVKMLYVFTCRRDAQRPRQKDPYYRDFFRVTPLTNEHRRHARAGRLA